MGDRVDWDIEEWLAAEQAGDDDRAERAMLRVMAHVRRSEPRAAFAGAVLRAAGFGTPTARPWSPWLRVAIVVCLLAAGLSVAVLPSVVLGTLVPIAHNVALNAFSVLWHLLARVVSAAFALWAVLSNVSAIVRAAAGSETGILVLLANVLVATVSLVGLKRLLGAREELAQC